MLPRKRRDKLALPDDGPSKHTGKGDKSDPSDFTENTKQTVTRFLIDSVSPELSCFVQDTRSTAPTDTLWMSDEEGQRCDRRA